MIELYAKFLEVLDSDLKSIFEHQKEYIYCKEGCSFCCEQGEYPHSFLEYQYLMFGFEKLDIFLQAKIKQEIINIKKTQEKLYKCPFLIEKKCSVYKYRSLVCRTFGLLSYNNAGKITCPFCYELGLNYSQIYDLKENMLSEKLYEKYNIKNIPKVFNLSSNNIKNLDIIKELNINFGEIKRLIDWL